MTSPVTTSLSIITIEIHMFRGKGPPAGIDERLDRFGHVGISCDNGTTIEGFNPVKPPGMSRSKFLSRLAAGQSFLGQVTPDTWLFPEAEKSRLKRCAKALLNANICLQVKRQLENDRNNSPLSYKRYAFPPRTAGGFAPNTFNCLTYPLSLGIPAALYPYQSGRLGDYLVKDEYLIIKYECR